jgi:hypothetical protein
MKYLLIFLLFLFSFHSSFAEYGGFHIKFELVLNDGSTEIGYEYLIENYIIEDSLRSDEYLLKAIMNNIIRDNSPDSLLFFEHRFPYYYSFPEDTSAEIFTIYYLSNKKRVQLKDLKKVHLLTIINQSYLSGISNNLSISDTSWIYSKPIQSFVFSGYLCSYLVYIHSKTPKTDFLLNELNAVQLKINEAFKEQELQPDEFPEKEEFDGDIYKILEELFNERVVVVGECTC